MKPAPECGASAATAINGLNDPKTGQDAQAFFPNINGYPVVRWIGNGQVNFQANQPLGGGNTSTYNDTTDVVDVRRHAQLDARRTRLQIRR